MKGSTKDILASVSRSLSSGERVALLCVTSSQGSTPRKGGAMMVLTAGGDTLGTVGGGALELQALEAAAEALSQGESRILRFELTGSDVKGTVPVCGGNAEVLVDFLDPSDIELRQCFEAACSAEESGSPGWLCLTFARSSARPRVRHSLIVGEEGREPAAAAISLPWEAKAALKKSDHLPGAFVVAELPEGEVFLGCSLGRRSRALVFGGGHIGQALVPVLKGLDFKVTVFDDRPQFARSEIMPLADAVARLPESYEGAFAGLEVDKDSYVIIVTWGHRGDKRVLEQALATEAGYIGMISSAAKRDKVFAALRREGVSPGQLDRVHSPIGLAIGAETPAEIAISIAAEMVGERSRRRGVLW